MDPPYRHPILRYRETGWTRLACGGGCSMLFGTRSGSGRGSAGGDGGWRAVGVKGAGITAVKASCRALLWLEPVVESCPGSV